MNRSCDGDDKVDEKLPSQHDPSDVWSLTNRSGCFGDGKSCPVYSFMFSTGGRPCCCPGGMPAHTPNVQVMQYCLYLLNSNLDVSGQSSVFEWCGRTDSPKGWWSCPGFEVRQMGRAWRRLAQYIPRTAHLSHLRSYTPPLPYHIPHTTSHSHHHSSFSSFAKALIAHLVQLCS
jgi:hypothetical protein